MALLLVGTDMELKLTPGAIRYTLTMACVHCVCVCVCACARMLESRRMMFVVYSCFGLFFISWTEF